MTSNDILKKYWGYSSFRGLQERVIQSVLQGQDVFALLPTGGGKSICFQVPAMMRSGLCLVITPLIALMKDQVEGLEKKGIGAMAIHSGMTGMEVRRILDETARDAAIKFLYVSPERLTTILFSQYIDALDISLVAIDEAHCISQWGYDFRPSYLRIAQLRNELSPKVPFIALTASATPLVQQDIIEKLKLHQPALFRQSFERPELAYRVFPTDSKINKAMEVLQKMPGSSIVYCGTRRKTQEVTRLLLLQGVPAEYYHAGLTQEERNHKQQAWINGETRVIVCTNAFGMGIDKPDVRTVIHYDTPDCLENYYQEAGRAGRDGRRSYAVLLYQQQDVEALNQLPQARYPSLEEIRRVYQALADFLNIPIGLGEGNYYDFDFNEFIQNFQIDSRLALNAIKMLEQEGHLSFKENVFLPAKVLFTAGREQLFEIESMYPHLDQVMKSLLRTYEGIYDNQVAIYDKQIARICRLTVEEVRAQLLQLHQLGIIEYRPQKETPQLQYLLNRAPADFLHVDAKSYAKRKELYVQRVQAMERYLLSRQLCRSKTIAVYFGDEGARDCGVCDNCLQRKNNKEPSAESFRHIEQAIRKVLSGRKMLVKELQEQLPDFTTEQVNQVIHFLLSEEMIAENEDGCIYLPS